MFTTDLGELEQEKVEIGGEGKTYVGILDAFEFRVHMRARQRRMLRSPRSLYRVPWW